MLLHRSLQPVMKKSRFNASFRDYAKNHLSPKDQERAFVNDIYKSFQEVLGTGNTLQIGSYPRFTSITPVHDLDILYLCGTWEPNISDPSKILFDLKDHIENKYTNPTHYKIKVEPPQTHSVTVSFLDGEECFFSVDIVPAYSYRINEFGEETYMVPEILLKNRKTRSAYYTELSKRGSKMLWIRSDPRGYIKVAQQINEKNSDFRKAVKFIKAWKAAHKGANDAFKLKSFHLEQILTEYFLKTPSLEFFDAVFNFFCDLPEHIMAPKIQDRAHTKRYIDDYLADLTTEDRKNIIQARDFFLIKLENFSEVNDPSMLFQVGFRERKDALEAYLFDKKIPTLVEENLQIKGSISRPGSSLVERILDTLGFIEVDKCIKFRTTGVEPQADVFKWKVKNDDDAPEPRGEITNHSTRNDPEHTQYKGHHYVECFAIRNGVCIAKAHQDVKI